MLLDPKTIIVKRDDRQRRDLEDLSELKASIKNQGQINPVIVRRVGDETLLVAGERRLRSCMELGISVEVKFWDELTPTQAEIIELEENVKRTDLQWRDQVSAIKRINTLKSVENKGKWTLQNLADELGYSLGHTSEIMTVAKNLQSPLLKDSTGIKHAFSVLQRQAERLTASIVSEIAEEAKTTFAPAPAPIAQKPINTASSAPQEGPTEPNSPAPIPAPIAPPTAPILNLSFLEWAKDYNGPKFNLIHCDFPFGIKFTGGMGQEEHGIKYEEDEDTYWRLLECLCSHTDRLASYSSHLIFWFSMSFYTETCQKLRGAGWKVQDHPLIWYKSDGQGIVPGRNEYPRRIYETALLASRGQRPLCKMFDNVKAAPRASGTGAIHPSQKPEPVLRHFFEGVVDNTTDMLDPTCGSGTALRAAEDVGARTVLGLELNPDFAKAANNATMNARLLRRASK